MIDRKNLTILIVDDEPEILEFLTEELNYIGYKTLSANSGNQAITVLNNNIVDIVLSDYKMPDGTGMVLLAHVNQMARPAIFFFVSGQADLSIEETISAGAKKFFMKPFDFEEFIKEMEETILELKK